MERLVANLLDLGRLRAGVAPVLLRPTAVGDVVRAAVAGLPEGSVAPSVRIGAVDGLPRALADPGLLERALADLLAAARSAAGPGPVTVGAGLVAGRVHVRVVGRGAVGGPGVAVAEGFVGAMNGELTTEEAPGGGTAYVIALVRAAA